MSDRSAHDQQIDYIEFSAPDLQAVRQFYETVFGWEFRSWGDDYLSFKDGGNNGGFRQGEGSRAGPLVVLYAADLEGTEAKVKEAGGTVVVETFDFPGGRRFHFTDPAGNELAVWSEPA